MLCAGAYDLLLWPPLPRLSMAASNVVTVDGRGDYYDYFVFLVITMYEYPIELDVPAVG